MKNKYDVSLLYVGTVNMEVEADSPQEALEIAYYSDEAYVALCHHCDGEITLNDDPKGMVYLGDECQLDDTYSGHLRREIDKLNKELQEMRLKYEQK